MAIADRRARAENGIALLVVLLATTLLMALGGGLAVLAATEARIAAHFAAGMEALYAADAALERALADLQAPAGWAAALDGSASSFVDGGVGVRALPDGSTLDLAAPPDAPGGPWRLYVHAPIDRLSPPGRIQSRAYTVVWLGAPVDAAADAIVLRAEAYAPYGARRAIEALVTHDGTALRILAWREL
jgi:hypothetical protein